MCGIYGFFGSPDAKLFGKMGEAISHRGPDEFGEHSDENVSIGIRRLSIIDLTTGQVPVSNEDQTVWVVQNGEIYNYKELTNELKEKGHRFRTCGDTETIVHLYEEFGISFLNKLRGMFAIAIYDRNNKKLILARDRVGKKPLYYYRDGWRLYFSSELKSFYHAPFFGRELDHRAVADYLTYLYIPAPRTIYKDVKKLPPGEALIIDEKATASIRYWKLEFGAEFTDSFEELQRRVYDGLSEAVRIRMVSDVPLGVFLSGGLDSAAITGLMAQYSSTPVKAFTVGFDEMDRGYDEIRIAKSVAKRFGCEHYHQNLKYDVASLLPQVLWHFDEPFGNSTSVLTYLLSEYTKQFVKVALSGTGGDECFLGYPRYWGMSMAAVYSLIPKWAREGIISPTINVLPEPTRGNGYYDRLFKRLKRFTSSFEMSPKGRYLSYLEYFGIAQQRALLKPEFWTEISDYEPKSIAGASWDTALPGDLHRAFNTDVNNFLPYNQLEYVDKMSMAKSLEVRAPFCDHKLLELSAKIHPRFKLRQMQGKYILKKAMGGLLSDDIIYRKKVGFDAPVGQWLKGGLRGLFEFIFSNGSSKVFNEKAVRELFYLHLSGRKDYSVHLWMILVLEIWFRMNIEQSIIDKPDFGLGELVGYGGNQRLKEYEASIAKS